jgi:uncharacterized protein
MVTRPRQVGKTTILQHLCKDNRTNVTLDDPTLAVLAREEPALFLQRFSTPVLIDEIQYAPELLPYIKIAVGKDKKKGMFWLTGSQQFQLMKGVTESLAGRVGIVNLLSLSLKEKQGHSEIAIPFLPETKQLQLRQKFFSATSTKGIIFCNSPTPNRQKGLFKRVPSFNSKNHRLTLH